MNCLSCLDLGTAGRGTGNAQWLQVQPTSMPVIKQVALAVRSLRKNPGFAVTAIITLALGIGASTAIFSVVNAVLLRPLPYEAPERLAVVWAELRNRNVRNFPFAPADFKDFRDRGGETFSDIAAVQTGRITITDDAARPEMVRVAFVTSNLFSTLGLRSVVGRTFIDDDGAPQPPAPAQNAAQAQPQGAGAPQQLPQLCAHGWVGVGGHGADQGSPGHVADRR